METAASRLEVAVYIQVAISIVLVFVWFSFPPPLFEGAPKVICIVYFLMLIGVSVSSFVWLLRYGNRPVSETITSGSKYRMIASLAISILAFMGSAFFVLFALMVSGLLNMI
jgi:hypothetical protein